MLTKLLVKTFIKQNQNIKSKEARQAYGYLGGFVGIISNIILFGAKLTIGLLINSIAVIADSFNNLSDAASSIITIIGFKISNIPADKEHPFGHGRIEYISALVVSFMVMYVGFEFIKSSYARIVSPENVDFNVEALIIMFLSIIVKIWLSRFSKKIGKTIDSKAMIASAMDSLSDAIITSVVVFSLVISRWITFPLDGYIGIFMALFIMYTGISLIRDTLNPLLGEAPEQEFVQEILEQTLSYEGIIGVHDLIVHNYGPTNRVVSLHAEIPANMNIMKAHDLIDEAEKIISQDMDIHLVIHMDPINTDDEVVQKTQEEVIDVLNKLSLNLSIHDFRLVGEGENKNVIFDMVVPHEVREREEKKIVQEVKQAIKDKYPKYDAVITVDRDYVVLR